MKEKEFTDMCHKIIKSKKEAHKGIKDPTIKYFVDVVKYIRQKSKDKNYEVIPHSYMDRCNPYSAEMGTIYCFRVINTNTRDFKDIFIKRKYSCDITNTKSITGVETDDVLDLNKDEITLSLDNYKIKINVKENKKEMTTRKQAMKERIKTYKKVYDNMYNEKGEELTASKLAEIAGVSASLTEYIKKYLKTYGVENLEEDMKRSTSEHMTEQDKAKMLKLFKEGKSRKDIAIGLRHVHHGTVTNLLKGLKPEDVKIEKETKPKRKAVKRSKSENKELKKLEAKNRELKAELAKLEAKNKKLEKSETMLNESIERLKARNEYLTKRIDKYENATLFERLMKLKF